MNRRPGPDGRSERSGERLVMCSLSGPAGSGVCSERCALRDRRRRCRCDHLGLGGRAGERRRPACAARPRAHSAFSASRMGIADTIRHTPLPVLYSRVGMYGIAFVLERPPPGRDFSTRLDPRAEYSVQFPFRSVLRGSVLSGAPGCPRCGCARHVCSLFVERDEFLAEGLQTEPATRSVDVQPEHGAPVLAVAQPDEPSVR